MNKPLQPGGGPGLGNRPGGGNRPANGNRPGRPNRPGDGNRPGIGNRPGDGNRPGQGNRPNRPNNIGNDINLNINNRPTWANIDNNRFNNINNQWRDNIVNRPDRGNWYNNHRDRYDHWHGWGNNVRDHWGHHHHHGDWFRGDWWNHHHHGWGGWHYHNHYHNHGWNYWWTVPTVAAVSSWFTWQAPAAVWQQPVYYDYGQGGNVYYENNTVYVDGDELCSADEYAQTAATLATVEPPANEEEAEQMEWMALGTFAVSSNENESEPSRVIQLAVSKTGIISGTLYNTQTDEAQTVQGQVDKDTQRVAVRIGESDKIVVETGIYNLTQDEAPVLVHYGTEQTENWLLVRLDEPDSDEESADS